MEYSFALFFNKLVSYTFLYWLPLYVKATRTYVCARACIMSSLVLFYGCIKATCVCQRHIMCICVLNSCTFHCFGADDNLTGAESDWLSTAFDVGGIVGKAGSYADTKL